MSSPVLYLIDGSSYIFRAYYAIKNLSTSDGFPTNAVYGFSSMMFKFVKDFNPRYVAMVFDAKGKNFRNDIYDQYKANREEAPEDLIAQIEKIHEVVNAFLFPLIIKEGYEADDLIGTIASANDKKGVDVVIVTGDKDFCQLVSENITLFDTMKNKRTDVQEVVNRYGVPPDRMLDLFALCGDKVDNIPGVRGIGGKTASKLIREFNSLENLYENLDKLTKKQRSMLENSKDDAFMSRELLAIKTDVDVETDYTKFAYEGFDRDKLINIFDELEFRNLEKELEHGSSQKNDKKIEGRGKKSEYSLVTDEKQLDDLVERVTESGELSIDIETTSRYPMLAELVGIAMSTKAEQGSYIPVGHKNCEHHKQLETDLVLAKLRSILESEKVRKIGQNLKYEYIVFHNYGIELKGIYFDTMLAAHLLDSSRTSYRLDELSRIYLSHKMTSYKDVTGKGKSQIGFADVEVEVAMNYSCEDSDITMQLYRKLYEELDSEKLLETYYEKVLSIVKVLAEIEINGVKVDLDILTELSGMFREDLERISEEIYSAVGYEFNLNSPLQLREVLFSDLNLPVKKKTKSGEPSTDYEVLLDLCKYHPVPDLVLAYRTLSKLLSTYVDSLPRLINPSTKRLHTSYNPVGTTTGRLSSSDPNLQNIPIKSEEGRRIRRAFVPEEGFILVSADYSQIELRLLAHYSGDEKLVDAFLNNRDIHNRTASEIFQVDEDQITPEMRRLSKTINFGIIYGISPYGLARQLGTSVSQSRDYIEKYFSRYSSVQAYMERSVSEAQNKGYAETIIGRRRPIPELGSSNRFQRGIGERAAINTPIQGSAADIINIAMININRRLEGYGSKMILQVHDELILETDKSEVEDIKNMVRKEMESAIIIKVPLRVEIKTGKNWAEVN